MNDFKKGLLVGMLIIIGCGVFVANTSDNDVNRYTYHNEGGYSLMLDTKSGTLYVSGVKDEWKEWRNLKELTK